MTCTDSRVLTVIYLLKNLIEIISTAIPIILIIMISIDISKIVLNADDRNILTVRKVIARRAIAAILVFFIPTIINIFMNALNMGKISDMSCWKNANKETIERYRQIEKEKEAQRSAEISAEKKEAKLEREKEILLKEQARVKALELQKKAELEGWANRPGVGGLRNGIIHYYQWKYPDPKVHYYGYGPTRKWGTIKSHGCGPTSAAIILSSYLGPDGHDPITITRDLCKRFHGCGSNGSYFERLVELLRSYGLSASGVVYINKSTINQLIHSTLSEPNTVMLITVSGMDGDPFCGDNFTTGGHYLVLTGIDSQGKIIMSDPAKTINNNITRPVQEITRCMVRYSTIKGGSL